MVNALILGNIGYNHCGPTVLIMEYANRNNKNNNIQSREMLWIEGQSNDASCGQGRQPCQKGISPAQDEAAAEHILREGAEPSHGGFAGSELVSLEEYKMMEAKDISV